MTIQVPIEGATNLWTAPTHAANAWRGRCLDQFARAEAAVSETLLTLSAAAPSGACVALPHLVGQRWAALEKALSENGPFATQGAPVLPLLAAVRVHDELRSFLCHGKGSIALERSGQWLLILRLLCFRAGKEDRQTRIVAERESDAIVIALGRSVSRLCARLERLRVEVAPPERVEERDICSPSPVCL